MGTELSESLSNAIKTIADNSSTKMVGTRTIEAVVSKVIDASSGLYAVNYSGNTFSAYVTDGKTVYKENDKVYILVPDNDFSKNKVILGASGPIQNSIILPDADYYLQKSEALLSFADIKMCTYESEKEEEIISSDIEYFQEFFPRYLNTYKTFGLYCNIQTSMDEIQKAAMGDYGLRLTIPTIQNGNKIERMFILNTDNMIGNPYSFVNKSLQKSIIQLEDDEVLDTDRSPKLIAYVTNFVNPRENDEPYDIFISDIELYAVAAVTESNSGSFLNIRYDKTGKYFSADNIRPKTLTAELYLNGFKKDIDFSTMQCFWFVENPLIEVTSKGYTAEGGIHWELISKDSISCEVKFEDVIISKEYKCVLIYDNVSYSSTASIYNCDSEGKIKLVTSTGSTSYPANTGTIDLICSVSDSLVPTVASNTETQNLSYIWSRYDSFEKSVGSNFYTENYINIYNTDNKTYDTSINFNVSIIQQKNRIRCSVIRNHKYMTEETYYKVNNEELEANTKYQEYKQKIKDLINKSATNIAALQKEYFYNEDGSLNDLGQLVQGTPETIEVEKIDQYFLGSRDIIITTNPNSDFIISIANSDICYKYDANGNAPTSENYNCGMSDKIHSIKPITWSLYDNVNMTELTGASRNEWIPRWSVLKYNTLLVPLDEPADEDDMYYYYDTDAFTYKIADTWNYNSTNNCFNLKLVNKNTGVELIATINNLVFIKDGDSGTNASPFVGLITYNGNRYGGYNINGRQQKLRFVYSEVDKEWYYYDSESYDDSTKEFGALIKVDKDSPQQLGITIYENGYITNSNYTIDWSLFDATTAVSSKLKRNISCVNVSKADDSENALIDIRRDNNGNTIEWAYVDENPVIYNNIIQAKITITTTDVNTSKNPKATIYAYYPIEITKLKLPIKGANYTLSKIAPDINGGFFTVVYNSDGTNPSYDTSSDFYCQDELFTEGECVYEYEWFSSDNFSIRADNNNPNVCQLIPIGRYNADNTCNYIKAELTLTEEIVEEYQNQLGELRTNADIAKANIHKNQDTIDFLAELTRKYNSERLELKKTKPILDKYEQCFQLLDKLYDILNNIEHISTLHLVNHKFDIKEDKENLLHILRDNSFISCRTANNLIQYTISKDNEDNDELNILIEDYNSGALKLAELWNEVFDAKDFIDFTEIRYTYDRLRAIVDTANFDLYEYNLYMRLNTALYSYYNATNYKTLVESLNEFDKMFTSVLQLTEDESTLQKVGIAKYYYDLIDTYTSELKQYNAVIRQIRYTLESGTDTIIHIRPLLILTDRTGFAAIDGWDGNRMYIDEEQGYLCGAQVGAGWRDHSAAGRDKFSGIVMGSKVNSSGRFTGLFGFDHEEQTMFLNSDDGSAIFGKTSGGQIIIDPQRDCARIFNAGYYTTSNYGVDDKPIKYDTYNTETGRWSNTDVRTGTGMMIDFTTPFIRFGSGNFEVLPNGFMTAKGGGSIAGWEISDNALSKDGVMIRSDNNTETNPELIAFKAGDNFSVNYKGELKAINVDLQGKITAISGKIGVFDINNSLSTNGKTWDGEGHDREGVYIGEEGIYLGSKFWVTKEGKLNATDIYLEGEIKAIKGTVGGFNINHHCIWSGSGSEEAGMYIYGDGPAFYAGAADGNNSPFRVYHDGRLYANNATIEGTITAKEGKIGELTISEGSLSINGESFFTTDNNGAHYINTNIINADSIVAKAANIGGWNIGSGQMYIEGNNGSGIWLNSSNKEISVKAEAYTYEIDPWETEPTEVTVQSIITLSTKNGLQMTGGSNGTSVFTFTPRCIRTGSGTVLWVLGATL